MAADAQKGRVVIKFVRSKDHPRGFLIDAELNPMSIDTLRQWAARRVDFAVTDADTNEDITRILLA